MTRNRFRKFIRLWILRPLMVLFISWWLLLFFALVVTPILWILEKDKDIRELWLGKHSFLRFMTWGYNPLPKNTDWQWRK